MVDMEKRTVNWSGKGHGFTEEEKLAVVKAIEEDTDPRTLITLEQAKNAGKQL